MDIFNSFISYLSIIGYSTRTISTKTTRINFFREWIKDRDINQIKQVDIRRFYRHLQKVKADSKIRTINLYMATVDQFFTFCLQMKHTNHHPFTGITLLQNDKQGERKPIKLETIKELYKACDTLQEKVLIILGYGAGLRAEEIYNLKVRDILLDKALIFVASGKNNKRRYIPIKANHLLILRQYIYESTLTLNAPLFTYQNGQMSLYLIRKIFKELQIKIGIKSSFYTLHHLRHSIASHLADSGVDVILIQQFLGHSNIETTQKYITLQNTNLDSGADHPQ